MNETLVSWYEVHKSDLEAAGWSAFIRLSESNPGFLYTCLEIAGGDFVGRVEVFEGDYAPAVELIIARIGDDNSFEDTVEYSDMNDPSVVREMADRLVTLLMPSQSSEADAPTNGPGSG